MVSFLARERESHGYVGDLGGFDATLAKVGRSLVVANPAVGLRLAKPLVRGRVAILAPHRRISSVRAGPMWGEDADPMRHGRPGLPPTGETLVAQHLVVWSLLAADERQRLLRIADELLSRKRWEAARGFELDDTVRVVIAPRGRRCRRPGRGDPRDAGLRSPDGPTCRCCRPGSRRQGRPADVPCHHRPHHLISSAPPVAAPRRP